MCSVLQRDSSAAQQPAMKKGDREGRRVVREGGIKRGSKERVEEKGREFEGGWRERGREEGSMEEGGGGGGGIKRERKAGGKRPMI